MNPLVKTEFTQYEQRLGKAIDHFKNEMTNIRAGRANPNILNKIMVDYYGTPTPINQMANISVPEARSLVIALWDASALKDVKKAILSSDLGLTPIDDGKSIRLNFPQLTEEKRKELIKQVKKTCEDSKVVLRNERRDINEKIKAFKKDNTITEDEVVTYDKEVQKSLDKSTETLDKLLKEKEKELLEV